MSYNNCYVIIFTIIISTQFCLNSCKPISKQDEKLSDESVVYPSNVQEHEQEQEEISVPSSGSDTIIYPIRDKNKKPSESGTQNDAQSTEEISEPSTESSNESDAQSAEEVLESKSETDTIEASEENSNESQHNKEGQNSKGSQNSNESLNSKESINSKESEEKSKESQNESEEKSKESQKSVKSKDSCFNETFTRLNEFKSTESNGKDENEKLCEQLCSKCDGSENVFDISEPSCFCKVNNVKAVKCLENEVTDEVKMKVIAYVETHPKSDEEKAVAQYLREREDLSLNRNRRCCGTTLGMELPKRSGKDPKLAQETNLDDESNEFLGGRRKIDAGNLDAAWRKALSAEDTSPEKSSELDIDYGDSDEKPKTPKVKRGKFIESRRIYKYEPPATYKSKLKQNNDIDNNSEDGKNKKLTKSSYLGQEGPKYKYNSLDEMKERQYEEDETETKKLSKLPNYLKSKNKMKYKSNDEKDKDTKDPYTNNKEELIDMGNNKKITLNELLNRIKLEKDKNPNDSIDQFEEQDDHKKPKIGSTKYKMKNKMDKNKSEDILEETPKIMKSKKKTEELKGKYKSGNKDIPEEDSKSMEEASNAKKNRQSLDEMIHEQEMKRQQFLEAIRSKYAKTSVDSNENEQNGKDNEKIKDVKNRNSFVGSSKKIENNDNNDKKRKVKGDNDEEPVETQKKFSLRFRSKFPIKEEDSVEEPNTISNKYKSDSGRKLNILGETKKNKDSSNNKDGSLKATSPYSRKPVVSPFIDNNDDTEETNLKPKYFSRKHVDPVQPETITKKKLTFQNMKKKSNEDLKEDTNKKTKLFPKHNSEEIDEKEVIMKPKKVVSKFKSKDIVKEYSEKDNEVIKPSKNIDDLQGLISKIRALYGKNERTKPNSGTSDKQLLGKSRQSSSQSKNEKDSKLRYARGPDYDDDDDDSEDTTEEESEEIMDPKMGKHSNPIVKLSKNVYKSYKANQLEDSNEHDGDSNYSGDSSNKSKDIKKSTLGSRKNSYQKLDSEEDETPTLKELKAKYSGQKVKDIKLKLPHYKQQDEDEYDDVEDTMDEENTNEDMESDSKEFMKSKSKSKYNKLKEELQQKKKNRENENSKYKSLGAKNLSYQKKARSDEEPISPFEFPEEVIDKTMSEATTQEEKRKLLEQSLKDMLKINEKRKPGDVVNTEAPPPELLVNAPENEKTDLKLLEIRIKQMLEKMKPYSMTEDGKRKEYPKNVTFDFRTPTPLSQSNPKYKLQNLDSKEAVDKKPSLKEIIEQRKAERLSSTLQKPKISRSSSPDINVNLDSVDPDDQVHCQRCLDAMSRLSNPANKMLGQKQNTRSINPTDQNIINENNKNNPTSEDQQKYINCQCYKNLQETFPKNANIAHDELLGKPFNMEDVSKTYENMKTGVETNWNDLSNKVTKGITDIKTNIKNEYENVSNKPIVKDTTDQITQRITDMHIGDKIEDAKHKIKDEYQSITDKGIQGNMKDISDSISNVGGRIKNEFQHMSDKIVGEPNPVYLGQPIMIPYNHQMPMIPNQHVYIPPQMIIPSDTMKNTYVQAKYINNNNRDYVPRNGNNNYVYSPQTHQNTMSGNENPPINQN